MESYKFIERGAAQLLADDTLEQLYDDGKTPRELLEDPDAVMTIYTTMLLKDNTGISGELSQEFGSINGEIVLFGICDEMGLPYSDGDIFGLYELAGRENPCKNTLTEPNPYTLEATRKRGYIMNDISGNTPKIVAKLIGYKYTKEELESLGKEFGESQISQVIEEFFDEKNSVLSEPEIYSPEVYVEAVVDYMNIEWPADTTDLEDETLESIVYAVIMRLDSGGYDDAMLESEDEEDAKQDILEYCEGYLTEIGETDYSPEDVRARVISKMELNWENFESLGEEGDDNYETTIFWSNVNRVKERLVEDGFGTYELKSMGEEAGKEKIQSYIDDYLFAIDDEENFDKESFLVAVIDALELPWLNEEEKEFVTFPDGMDDEDFINEVANETVAALVKENYTATFFVNNPDDVNIIEDFIETRLFGNSLPQVKIDKIYNRVLDIFELDWAKRIIPSNGESGIFSSDLYM